MPAEGLPWLERDEILTLRGDRAPRRACSRRWASRDVRLTGGEPLVRRDFPRLAAMLAARCRRRRPRAHDQRLPARARRRRARRRRRPPLQRLDRLAPARPLLRDDAARRAAAGAARARGARRLPRGAPDQGQRGRDPRLHRAGGAAVRASSRASIPTRCASSSSCRSTPTTRGRRPGPDGRRDPRADRRGPPAGARAARAERHGARLPVRRRPGPDRLHRPGQRAVLRRLRPDPHHRRGPLRTCLFSINETDLREPLRAGAATTSSSTIIRDAVWRKELKHHVNEPGFVQPARTMSRHRRVTPLSRSRPSRD